MFCFRLKRAKSKKVNDVKDKDILLWMIQSYLNAIDVYAACAHSIPIIHFTRNDVYGFSPSPGGSFLTFSSFFLILNHRIIILRSSMRQQYYNYALYLIGNDDLKCRNVFFFLKKKIPFNFAWFTGLQNGSVRTQRIALIY